MSIRPFLIDVPIKQSIQQLFWLKDYRYDYKLQTTKPVVAEPSLDISPPLSPSPDLSNSSGDGSFLQMGPPPLPAHVDGRSMRSPVVRFSKPSSAGGVSEGRAAPSQVRYTLVHYWSTTCPPCLKELREVIQWANSLKSQGVEVKFVAAETDGSLLDKRYEQRFREDGGTVADLTGMGFGKNRDSLPRTILYRGKINNPSNTSQTPLIIKRGVMQLSDYTDFQTRIEKKK